MYDLHGVAYKWLEDKGFFNLSMTGLLRENVYFELTKQEKLQRIRITRGVSVARSHDQETMCEGIDLVGNDLASVQTPLGSSVTLIPAPTTAISISVRGMNRR